ncbi:paraquat-inducible protein A [Crocinitomix catalasitica]|uniref:paraquat-inducible protein A n=1 Tax=Crocinitomix catalasitica TaxID=184607 RepID=UPI000482AF47|nr:paraquat-inducible protein A [Crocinitomix catalasitica]
MRQKNKIRGISYILFLNIVLVAGLIIGFNALKDAQKINQIKNDYFSANQISLGLLDPLNWSNQVNTILQMEVDSFSLSAKNEKILEQEIQNVMHRVFDEIEIVLNEEQDQVKDKIKFGLLRGAIDLGKFKERIPQFSDAILDEIEKASNKDEVKEVLKQSVTKALKIEENQAQTMRDSIITQYGVDSLTSFNTVASEQASVLELDQRNRSWALISLMIIMLLTWFISIRMKDFLILTFIYCVLLAFVNLVIAINLPMIEIDARIDQLDIPILSSNILFSDQIIFYQSKSIFDVISLMMTKGKLDAVFVGVLLFIFSVIFPVFKLISSIIYLFMKYKAGKIVKYIAFKSGKWSMADVMVIAIFMAFVGFQGILDAQLADLEMSAEKINLLSTNRTNLQYGYLVFVAFVLSNLVLSEILKYITKKNLLANELNDTTNDIATDQKIKPITH